MSKPTVRTTLNEDFEALGLPQLNVEDSARIAGIEQQEGSCGDKEDDDEEKEEAEEAPPVCDKCKSGEKDCKCDVKKEDEDPIDGTYVTSELFDRIRNLPFDEMTAEDCQDLLDALKEKDLPEDIGLQAEATEIVSMIMEVASEKQRRFKKFSMAKKNVFVCKPGYRAKPGTPAGQKAPCVPSHVAAGGLGNLRGEARKKVRSVRKGPGATSKRKSTRWGDKREGLMSPLALELAQVTEGISEAVPTTVRDEIIERVVTIIELLNEEFNDISVTQIYSEAVESLIDTYEAGRLDEDVMNEDEFIAEMDNALSLITKSIEKLEDGEELGNE